MNRPVRRVEQVMGMPVSLALRGRHAEDSLGSAAWARVLEELRWVDAVFSTYRADSMISRLARGQVALGECPPEVAEVLGLGESARLASGGAFDVHQPDGQGTSVLDPSGVVKGWAVQRAARHLDDLDDTDYSLCAGGDLVCRTACTGSPGWRIGIEDPRDPERLVAVVPIHNGAVATSGPTHRGAHIVDPRTGAPAGGLASVTVVADDLTWADIDATAAYVLGTEAVAWLESRGRCGLVVHEDGRAEVFPRSAGVLSRAS